MNFGGRIQELIFACKVANKSMNEQQKQTIFIHFLNTK